MSNDRDQYGRDIEIKRIFENADDSIMGILGYNIFLNVVETIPHPTKVQKFMPDVYYKYAKQRIEEAIQRGDLPNKLPEEIKEFYINNFRKNSSFIPCTLIWDRDYDKNDLATSVNSIFVPFSMKTSFVYMLSVFESTIGEFIDRLNEFGEKQRDLYGKDLTLFENRNIKNFICWAYAGADKNTISHKDLIKILPLSIRYIDIARWFRNCITHNRGLIAQSYNDSKPTKLKQYEEILCIDVDYDFMEAEIEKYINLRPLDRVESILSSDFTLFSRAIMDVLFLVHDSIQENFFNVKESYNYVEERKRINFRELYEC